MRYIIISTLIFANFLFALPLDIIELYRTKGINAVEKVINTQLTNKEYWDNNLKSKDVSNGYYESIRYVVICQKDLKDIVLYDTLKKEKLFSSSVFTGKADGDKKKEGDMKTPIGAYKLTKKLTKLDPFYGPLALTTNYPNIYDKANGKTGHGIWIHGLPEKGDRDDFTQGCIALDNTKIKKLDNSINLDNSVLVISENKLNKVSKKDISLVLSNIFSWRDAWKQSDIKRYLAFYDDAFKKSNGQNFSKFSQFKRKIFNKKESKIIKFSNINVIPYPNDMNKKIFKVIMDEYYKTKIINLMEKKNFTLR